MGTTDVPVLRATGVTKRFGHVEALRGASLEVRPGEVHALLGDNGAGKSTLVKMLSGVHSPDEGTIEIDGRAVRFGTPRDAQEAGVETVYQDLALASTLPPGDNVFLGRELLKPGLLGKLGFVDRPAMRRRAAEELATVGARVPSPIVPVSALSGGQKQAVAISRSLIWGRRLLIMDEPTAALGVKESRRVLELMLDVKRRGLPIVLISHNMPHVFEVADRIHIHRLGRRLAVIDPKQYTMSDAVAFMTGAKVPPEAALAA
jgi:fructose transport system ATP-binding protein